MSYTLGTPDSFLRQARKFLQKHPDLKPKLKLILEKLQNDPFQPGLKLHALTGNLGRLACRQPDLQFPYHLDVASDREGNRSVGHR